MFLIGLELDQELLQSHVGKYAVTGLIGVGIPLVFSIPVSWILYSSGGWAAPEESFIVFALFTGLGMSIHL